MRGFMLAAVAALALASFAGSAAAFSGPSGAGKTVMGPSHGGVHVPALRARRDHPLCTRGKPCGHACIKASDVCHKL
jgi:hypothetical protein